MSDPAPTPPSNKATQTMPQAPEAPDTPLGIEENQTVFAAQPPAAAPAEAEVHHYATLMFYGETAAPQVVANIKDILRFYSRQQVPKPFGPAAQGVIRDAAARVDSRIMATLNAFDGWTADAIKTEENLWDAQYETAHCRLQFLVVDHNYTISHAEQELRQALVAEGHAEGELAEKIKDATNWKEYMSAILRDANLQFLRVKIPMLCALEELLGQPAADMLILAWGLQRIQPMVFQADSLLWRRVGSATNFVREKLRKWESKSFKISDAADIARTEFLHGKAAPAA
jgi:hypothetical protein